MKRTYSPTRNIGSLWSELSTGARVLIVVVLLLPIRIASPSTFFSLVEPLLSGANVLSRATRLMFTEVYTSAHYREENDALRTSIASLRNENDALKQQVTHVMDMVGALQGIERISPSIVATVIARPPQSPYDTLLITKGNQNGVRKGMEVFSQERTPVGIVSAASDDYAQVTLFSSYGTITYGWVGSKTVPIELRGNGGGTFAATLPRPSIVQVGDRVYVPGPGLLPLGSVARIDDDPSNPAVTLRIVPLTNLYALSMVLLQDTGLNAGAVQVATSTAL